jgi:serine phosphatase RsbU (regulator of sigma subunit)
MPGMLGIELLRSAKKIRPDLLLYLMTAHNDWEQIVQAVNKVGIHGFLQKPLDMSEIELVLASAAQTILLRNENQTLVNDLLQMNRNLEDLVRERTAELMQRDQRIHESLLYAQGIQNASLTERKFFADNFADHFILFKPRDIVSGDFYWAYQCPDRENYIIAVADCTGHGVPGAMLSMLGMKTLDSIVYLGGLYQPDLILNELHTSTQHNLRQHDTGNVDGMDIGILKWNKRTRILQFSGAKIPLIYFEKGVLKRINPTPREIGGMRPRNDKSFEIVALHLPEPTPIYLYSDGYLDQFGGKQKERYMSKRLFNTLTDCHLQPMELQGIRLKTEISQWMRSGNERQLDDILVMGIML